MDYVQSEADTAVASYTLTVNKLGGAQSVSQATESPSVLSRLDLTTSFREDESVTLPQKVL